MLESLLLASSIWITPVVTPANAKLVPITVPVGLDAWVRPEVWTIPVYKASSSDPQQRLLYNSASWQKVASGEWLRSGNRADAESDILWSSNPNFPFRGNYYSSISTSSWQLPSLFNAAAATPPLFHIPANAVPAPGWDGHMVIQQPNGTVLETYGTIRLASGTLIAQSYSIINPRRAGDGFENGQTASMIPAHLGLLSEDEIKTGRIDHALAITVPARMLKPVVAYPAFAFDRGAMTESPPYSGSLPMGSRLALAADANVDALGLQTNQGRVIAKAAKRYGFVVVDRGGEGISLRVLRNPSSTPSTVLRTWNYSLQQDLDRIFSRLVMVPPASVDAGVSSSNRRK